MRKKERKISHSGASGFNLWYANSKFEGKRVWEAIQVWETSGEGIREYWKKEYEERFIGRPVEIIVEAESQSGEEKRELAHLFKKVDDKGVISFVYRLVPGETPYHLCGRTTYTKHIRPAWEKLKKGDYTKTPIGNGKYWWYKNASLSSQSTAEQWKVNGGNYLGKARRW